VRQALAQQLPIDLRSLTAQPTWRLHAALALSGPITYKDPNTRFGGTTEGVSSASRPSRPVSG
jgi:hypothetical protein